MFSCIKCLTDYNHHKTRAEKRGYCSCSVRIQAVAPRARQVAFYTERGGLARVMDPEVQRCPGCGAEKLAAGAQWCKCNKSAPFRMMPASVTETVDALFVSIENKQRKLSALRNINKL